MEIADVLRDSREEPQNR